MAKRRRKASREAADRWVAAGVGLIIAWSVVTRLVAAYPVLVTALLVTVAITAMVWTYVRIQDARDRAEQERNIAVTDHMTGTEFEHYVARLMRASGCRAVRVSGGAGDMGADVVGVAPDGRRLVVQCKRYKGKLGSPDVQRFAGTARHIHRADVALLVTTGIATGQAVEVARKCHITLITRPALARWAHTRIPPIINWPLPHDSRMSIPVPDSPSRSDASARRPRSPISVGPVEPALSRTEDHT